MSAERVHPPIATEAEWREQRLALLAKEKAHTKEYDRINAERRRLPMVPIEKSYQFDTPEGTKSLLDLFEGRTQLIVYHFMFDPSWEKGCRGCTGFVDSLGDISMLNERDTTFALVSRAPLEKLEKYKKMKGWDRTWVSSGNTDFNYDYQATQDESKAPIEYNYKDYDTMVRESGSTDQEGESHGISVFFRIGDRAYHTYSVYARGVEDLVDSYRLLDLTPYGRQEDFEDSPEGWPQKPTYG